MKKILAIFLALITVLSITLVACNKDNTTKGNNTDDDGDDGDLIVGSQSTGDSEQNGSDAVSDSGTVGEWEKAEYTVYSMGDGLRVRSKPSSSGNILGTVNIGDSLAAKEKNNEYYKVTYNGQEAYVVSAYVTINSKEAKFVDDAEKTNLVIKEEGKNEDPYEVNARELPIFTDDIVRIELTREKTLNGELKKVGENEAGNIYKVEYNGKTYYIGNQAFKYFEGYTGGSQGGIG